MITNSAPMAAVYRRVHDNHLFSHPIAAWTTHYAAMVVLGGDCLELATSPRSGVEFLGIWQSGWNPTYDEMGPFLTGHVPGTRPQRCRHCSDGLETSLISTYTRSDFCGANPDDGHVPQD